MCLCISCSKMEFQFQELLELDNYLTDANKQKEVLDFLSRLQLSLNGWKICAQAILIDSASYQLKFLCFQVLEHFIKLRYAAVDSIEQAVLRQYLLKLFAYATNKVPPAADVRNARAAQTTSSSAGLDQSFMHNKIAALFAQVFMVDFPNRWPSILRDCFLNEFELESNCSKTIELYLKCVIAIDTEVADREIHRSKEELERNTLVKDRMRELCVGDIVTSWQQILSKCCAKPGSEKLVCLCLNAIGAYVQWVDIGLVANNSVMPLVVFHLKTDDDGVLEAACDCLCSILSKGMEPISKMQLVEAIDSFLSESGVYDMSQTGRHNEMQLRLSVVINTMGTVLIDCWNKLVKSGQTGSVANEAVKLIESKLSALLGYLENTDADVSGNVAEFAHQYITLLKQAGNYADAQREIVRRMLLTVLKNSRYPVEYNYEKEGIIEAEFQEYRKEMKTIFMNIGMLDPDLTMQTVESFVSVILNAWQQMDFRDIELSVTLLFNLSEALPSTQGNHFASNNPRAQSLKALVRLLISSRVSLCRHIAVNLQFFETVVRYDRLFSIEPGLIEDVLAAFLDDRGLHHQSPIMRSRCAYLFSRFVKSLKSNLQFFVSEILQKLGDLIPPDATGNSLSSDDKLFLYESVGVLIVCGNFTPQEKSQFMENVLGNLWQKFAEGLHLLDAEISDETRSSVFEYLNNIMAFASRTSKAFSNQMTMEACQCTAVFVKMMQVFVDSLTPQNAQLLNGVRQYLHRMVICLEQDLLPFVPRFVQHFVSVIPDLKALQDFLILLQQILSKYKRQCIPYLQSELPSLYNAIWSALAQPFDPGDEVQCRDVLYLRRAYFQLLSSAVSNNVLDLISFSGNAACRDKVLTSLSDWVLDSTDATIQRTAVLIFHRCIDCVTSLKSGSSGNEDDLRWFDQFLYQKALSVCFSLPLKSSSFDFNDAQCAMVVGEIAKFLKKFYLYQGQSLLDFLKLVLFAQSGLPAEIVNELCLAIQTTDAKAFQKVVKNFFLKLIDCSISNSVLPR